MNSAAPKSGLVYSTESGKMCPACRHPVAQCVCNRNNNQPATDGIVRIFRETGGRGGKTVTLVKGVPLNTAELTTLAKQLKAACGSGGTVKDDVIEIQGDHRDRVMELLKERGWTLKRAGS